MDDNTRGSPQTLINLQLVDLGADFVRSPAPAVDRPHDCNDAIPVSTEEQPRSASVGVSGSSSTRSRNVLGDYGVGVPRGALNLRASGRVEFRNGLNTPRVLARPVQTTNAGRDARRNRSLGPSRNSQFRT